MPDEENGLNPQSGEDGDVSPQPQDDGGVTEPEVTPETPVDVESLPVNVQNLIRKTRKEAADNRAKAAKLEAEIRDSEDEKLAEQQKWEELATKRAAQIAELEPVVEERDRYREQVLSVLRAQTEGWPEEVLSMMPQGDDVDTLAKFVEQAIPVVEKLRSDAAQSRGVGQTPKPSGQLGGVSKDEMERRRAAFRRFVHQG